MADYIDADGFRANVGIVLCNDEQRLFWARRIGRSGWQFPQGGVLKGETTEQAMYRELTEEVGLKRSDVELLAQTSGWLRYRLPQRYRRRSSPECIGQKQRWFLLRLTGSEDQVCLDCTEHPEFDGWRWVDFWLPAAEVIFFKRRVYERALTELAPALFPDGAPPKDQG